MRRSLFIFLFTVLLLAVYECGGKKDQEVEEAVELETVAEETFKLGSCPAKSIRVSPDRVEDQEITIKSGKEVLLMATAYDHGGRPMNAPLSWSFRRPDIDSDQAAGGGHALIVKDDRSAVFSADGMAPGIFSVVVKDESCNLGTEEDPQYVEGQSWIKVYNDPGAEAACGRMRVTYGDRLDRMGDEVIASAKVLLLAEVSGHKNLGRKYRVKYHIDGKPYPGTRPLYPDNETVPVPGMEKGHISTLPVYLVPGDHAISYELLYKGEAVCGSRTERFNAR